MYEFEHRNREDACRSVAVSVLPSSPGPSRTTPLLPKFAELDTQFEELEIRVSDQQVRADLSMNQFRFRRAVVDRSSS